jgi:hypothetical protein
MASMRSMSAVPSKGSPIKSSELVELRGSRAGGGSERSCCCTSVRACTDDEELRCDDAAIGRDCDE